MAEALNKGHELRGQGKNEEAIKYYDQAISQDPNLAATAYIQKGFTLSGLGRGSEAFEAFKQAIAVGPNEWQGYYGMGNYYLETGKRDEALEVFQKALSVDKTQPHVYYALGNALVSLGRNQEALDNFEKTLSLNPDFWQAYSGKGNTYKALGQREKALECFEKLLAIDANNFAGSIGCAHIALELKQYEKAMSYYEKGTNIDPNNYHGYLGKARCLAELGKNEEALTWFSKAVSLKSDNPMILCLRAGCYASLQRQEESTADFKKAHELLTNGYGSADITVDAVAWMKSVLSNIVDLQNTADNVENKVKELDQSNPKVQDFVKKLQVLKTNKNKVLNTVVDQLEKNQPPTQADTQQNALKQLKEEFEKQFATFKKELAEVKADVAQIKSSIDEINVELQSKMTDYHKKLEMELNKLDLPSEDQAKIKEYFSAYISTFSSIFTTSQVVDSGQVSLDTGSSVATVLSTLASFAPFVGDFASQSISTISDFLQTKEMKTNARKMKGLASDSTELSQVVGASGFEIVSNSDKRQQIIAISEEAMGEKSSSLFKKLKQICDKFEEQVDAYLYTKLYKTPAARLGNEDANILIEEWIKDNVSPYNVKSEFVKIILRALNETPNGEASSPGKPDKAEKKAPCCNIF